MTRPMFSGSTMPARDLAELVAAARARNASRARRSGTRSRPRCSRSACRSGCCSSPSSAMISVPEACCRRGCRAARRRDQISAIRSGRKASGSVWGNSPSRTCTGTPAISQWPDGVSLPLRDLAGRAPAGRRTVPSPARRAPRGAAARPRPSRSRLGRRSGPGAQARRSAVPAAQAAAMWPNVSAPASPKASASAAPPMPKESMTMRMARGMLGPLSRTDHAAGDGPALPARSGRDGACETADRAGRRVVKA